VKLPRDLSGAELTLGDVAAHFELTRDELVKRLFGST